MQILIFYLTLTFTKNTNARHTNYLGSKFLMKNERINVNMLIKFYINKAQNNC